MKRAIDLARRFLVLADKDIKAFKKLVPDRDIDDSIVGFHAQQAVEKCIKAILALHEIPVRKIHDLHALLDLLDDHKLPTPPMREEIIELNPFAVLFRYELAETESLDRALAKKIVSAARDWAATCLKADA